MTLPLICILLVFTGYTATWFYYSRIDKREQKRKEFEAWMKGEGDTK